MNGSASFDILISVGVFLLVLLIAFGCSRVRAPDVRPSHRNSDIRTSSDRDPLKAEHGVDEATLESYPKLLFSEAKKGARAPTPSCCPICLVDYMDTDMLRFLPGCAHVFHLDCIDPWMRLHPTCPICRNTPVQDQHTTLIQEVDAMATRQTN
ncbi:RING-H2 finger protein ATL70 [Morella rubra]|uniref:RING-type E3 ubiquitin transferase n=1 Tax=Morella rubra TaxID=262757 RepID=A0A6A1WJF8_9ROSI|nr:RING-H2 finger protein ATL70 [Morella rubra]